LAKVKLFQQKRFFGGYRAKRMRGRDVESFCGDRFGHGS